MSWKICRKCGEYEHECRCATAAQEEQSQQPAPAAEQMNLVADAIKAEFRTLNPQWFVDDAKNNGSCDMTPWNLLALAALKSTPSPAQEKPPFYEQLRDYKVSQGHRTCAGIAQAALAVSSAAAEKEAVGSETLTAQKEVTSLGQSDTERLDVASEETGRVLPEDSSTRMLIQDFSEALLCKLAAAEKKYGYSNEWRSPNWAKECQEQFFEHIEKGDLRDVAIYCAFMWYHGWPIETKPQAAIDAARGLPIVSTPEPQSTASVSRSLESQLSGLRMYYKSSQAELSDQARTIASLQHQLTEAQRERDELQGWKREQMIVSANTRYHEIAREIGLTPGRDIASAILPAIQELKRQLAEAKA